MAVFTLPLDPTVEVNLDLAGPPVIGRTFDVALLIGQTSIITPEERIREYSSLDEMIADGFVTTDRLYQAATLLMSQQYQPDRFLIGCVGTVTDPPTEESGEPVTRPETPVESVQACYQASGEWYAVIYCNTATNEQLLDISALVEIASNEIIHCYTTADPNALLSDGTGIFAQMAALKYRRTFGQYSTKAPDAVAGIIGWALGAMRQPATNRAFTLKDKTVVGLLPENNDSAISSAAVNNIKTANGNIYINRGTYFDVFEWGLMANGFWFDEVIFLDKNINAIRMGIMNEFKSSNKIPQTEGGVSQIKAAILNVCQTMLLEGFVEPGTWLGKPVMALQTGSVLPNGFLIQSEPIASQSPEDRYQRKSPPIYLALKLAGAIHSVIVNVIIDR